MDGKPGTLKIQNVIPIINSKITYRLTTTLTILFHVNSFFSQNLTVEKRPDFKKNNIKINIIATTNLYLKSVVMGYERRFNYKHSLETGCGYTFYSKEDKCPTNGIYGSLSYNLTYSKSDRERLSINFMPFYQILFMNSYMKYENSFSGYGNKYDEYRKIHYTKERYGLTIILSQQYYVLKNIFIEFNEGVGIIGFRTKVPENVSQKTYKNGLFNYKEYVSPNIYVALKVGYAF